MQCTVSCAQTAKTTVSVVREGGSDSSVALTAVSVASERGSDSSVVQTTVFVEKVDAATPQQHRWLFP